MQNTIFNKCEWRAEDIGPLQHLDQELCDNN